MSTRYSSSPALRLQPGESPLAGALQVLLCLCLAACLATLALQGYPLLCLSLSPLVLVAWRRRKPAGGAVSAVIWRAGQWAVEYEGRVVPVALAPTSVVLPWCIHLAWMNSETQRRDGIWLFADCVPAAQLRQLRVRLALQH